MVAMDVLCLGTMLSGLAAGSHGSKDERSEDRGIGASEIRPIRGVNIKC